MDDMDVVKRRLEILKLEGLGLTRAEIVKQLSEKEECAPRTVYSDFETRATWQPILQSVVNPQDILLKVANRYEQIYRQASVRAFSSTNPSVQLGALNLMLKVNSMLVETLVLPDFVCRLKDLEKKAASGVFVP